VSRREQRPDENEVRDLLSQLGDALTEDVDSPRIPVEVDARITAALAELPPLHSGADDEVVVPLERPRRRVGGWLVAAALVVAVGGGGWALSHRSNSAHMASTSSAADSAGSARSPEPQSSEPLSATVGGGRLALPSISLASFGKDVSALLGSKTTALGDLRTPAKTPKDSPNADKAAEGQDYNGLQAPEFAPARPDCRRPSGTTGRQVEVSIDGRLGQLIVSPSAGKQVVTAYDCAGRKELATTTIP